MREQLNDAEEKRAAVITLKEIIMYLRMRVKAGKKRNRAVIFLSVLAL